MEQEQEIAGDSCKKWYFDEALSINRLQNGGTFRNTLALNIKELLTPLLANCIKAVDINCNLDLILASHAMDAYITEVWMKMFHYFFISEVQSVDADLGSNLTVPTFKCRMPFHWVIQALVNSEIHLLSAG